MSDNWNQYSLSGCLLEETPKAAPELSTPPGSVPDRVDLRIHCPPVENQMTTNSCVANAIVGAFELHQIKAGMALTDMSRLFVYYNARKLANNQNKDIGSYIHHGMAAVLAFGACEARLWPFDPAQINVEPSQACFQNASKHEAIQYARTPPGTSAQSALAEGLPVVFAMYAPMDYYAAASSTGIMPKPTEIMTLKPPSGHAMLLVGYDLSDQTYLARNSWSRNWGDNGYVKIPFETMQAWSRIEDFWTIGAIEQAAGFKLTGPSMVETLQSAGVTEEALASAPGKLDKLRGDLRARLSSDLETAKRDFRKRLRD